MPKISAYPDAGGLQASDQFVIARAGKNYSTYPGGSWQTWTPVWTNLSVGNGTIVSLYKIFKNMVEWDIELIFGSTTSISGSVEFTLPVNHGYTNSRPNLGLGNLFDSGVGVYSGSVFGSDVSHGRISAVDASGAYAALVNLSAAIPFTWAQNDIIHIHGQYRT